MSMAGQKNARDLPKKKVWSWSPVEAIQIPRHLDEVSIALAKEWCPLQMDLSTW